MRPASLAAMSAAVMLCGCADVSEPTSRTEFRMDTYMTVTVYDGDAEKAVKAAFERAEELEDKWSVTDDHSEVYKANHSGGESVAVSDDTVGLIRFAFDMSERTDGALDITLYPLQCEWGFTTGEYRVPTDERIAGLLRDTGCGKLTLGEGSLTVPNGMSIDLGSLGKGCAGDEMIKRLKENGVTSAMLDLGGNIQLIGSKPDGKDFRIAVKSPFDDGNIAKLDVSECAVITSGGYERFFEQDGNTYWHILDPDTGCPARSGLMSATVIGKQGRLCDALSTALFVMGEERAEQLWRESDDFEMLLITDDKRIVVSEGIADKMTVYDDYADIRIEVVEREE